MPRKPDIWVVPTAEGSTRNLWVLVAETRARGRTVRTLRVFTTEPPEALVLHACQALGPDATAMVMEVAADHVTDAELADVAC